jgi:hypothetical protein
MNCDSLVVDYALMNLLQFFVTKNETLVCSINNQFEIAISQFYHNILLMPWL